VDFAAHYYQRSVGEFALACLPPQLREVSAEQLARKIKKHNKINDLGISPAQTPPTLTAEQATALARLATDPGPFVLHGNTGSGKTEVYLRRAAQVLEDTPQAQKLLGRLGVEPLSGQFDVTAFSQALKKRQSAIKQVLLAGNEVVGVGNIYASEALFMAGIRPTTKAARLSKPRVARLHAAIVQVLTRAVEQGGSSLKARPRPRSTVGRAWSTAIACCDNTEKAKVPMAGRRPGPTGPVRPGNWSEATRKSARSGWLKLEVAKPCRRKSAQCSANSATSRPWCQSASRAQDSATGKSAF
jgi:ribosomal protein S13